MTEMKNSSDKSTNLLPKSHSQPIYKLTVKDWFIPMRDGIKLFAKAWHPEGNGPFPAVINYDPYRSSDWRTIARGNYFHFLARHGYVVLHVGVRGTDGSEGVVTDEYPLQEQLDGYDAVEWVAAQPWCNGNVGMMGTSYPAFTAIQVAMHQPPHLKAIIPLYGTDDRYTDDVHYLGGALKSLDDFAGWATMMVSMNALPPPHYIGENYDKIWNEHLEGNLPYQFNWFEHQTNDSYWRPASLRPNFDLIKCPVLIVGAWLDYYRNCALRMFEHLTVPKKLLMGPWGHVFPDWGYPGQPINFMPQIVRWFDHWLKGIDTGILDEPSFTVFMRESSGRKSSSKPSSGYWRAIHTWPFEDAYEDTYFLSSQGKLRKEVTDKGSDTYPYNVSVGMGHPTWNESFATVDDKARELDEANSIHYISDPLSEKVEIIGRPRLKLTFSATAPIVNVIAKLFDIAPDGSADLVTWGVLNVTHRESHTEPEPLTPKEKVKLNIELDATSWVFKPSHILKLSIAGSDFPNVWPSPYLADNAIWWGEDYNSCLVLPIVPKGSQEEAPVFGDIVMPLDRYVMNYDPVKANVIHDSQEGKTTVNFSTREEGEIPEDGVKFVYETDSAFTVSEKNPAHAVLNTTHDMQTLSKNTINRALTEAKLESNENEFDISYTLTVSVNDVEKHIQKWKRTYQRDLV